MVSIYGAETPASVTNGSGRWWGTRFTSSVPLTVTHLRFWATLDSYSTPVDGRLMLGGDTLVQVTYPTITATGWQTVELPEPVELDADTEYVVANWIAPIASSKPITSAFFDVEYIAGPITVPAMGGVFRNSGTPTGGAITSASDAALFADFIAIADGDAPEEHDGDGQPATVALTPGIGTGVPALAGAGGPASVLVAPDGLSSGAESGHPRIAGAGLSSGLVLVPGAGGPAIETQPAPDSQTWPVPATPTFWPAPATPTYWRVP